MREYNEDVCYRSDMGFCHEEVCDRNSPCSHNSEFLKILDHSGLPNLVGFNFNLSPFEIDREAFKYLANFRNNLEHHIDSGSNLLICGETTGNGKTTWAIKLLATYAGICSEYWNEYQPIYFIHVPTFITNLKLHISIKMPEFEKMLVNLDKADLVVWDDACISDLTKYEFDTLLSFIDRRVLARLSNIYTSNLSLKQMKKVLDPRLYSRISGSHQVTFMGPDWRVSK